MFKYAVVEIAGRQYKITPETSILVNFLGEIKTFECEKVLLKFEEEKLEIGKPYLKDKFLFEVEEKSIRGKIRVATYKSKANTRRVKGSKPIYSRIKLKINREKS